MLEDLLRLRAERDRLKARLEWVRAECVRLRVELDAFHSLFPAALTAVTEILPHGGGIESGLAPSTSVSPSEVDGAHISTKGAGDEHWETDQ